MTPPPREDSKFLEFQVYSHMQAQPEYIVIIAVNQYVQDSLG